MLDIIGAARHFENGILVENSFRFAHNGYDRKGIIEPQMKGKGALSTWMVVEDEPDIYEVLLAMFEMWGIEGVAFVDGEEAVAWIDDVDQARFQGELPELALLDIRLPGELNGVMVGERLRKSSVLGDMAIVLTTAFKLPPEEQSEAMETAQADLWLPKPLPKFNELQAVLEKVIAERREKRAAKQPPQEQQPAESPDGTQSK